MNYKKHPLINNHFRLNSLLTYGIALVWLINGLFCKLLNLVPRHQMIVAAILGNDHSFVTTKAIGFLEILMAVWVISRVKQRWCSITQVITIATMNIIEFFMVPDLLLFGKANILIALIFIVIILLNEFKLSAYTARNQ